METKTSVTAIKPTTAVILFFLLTFPQVTSTFFQAIRSPIKDFSLISSPARALDDHYGMSETLPPEAMDAFILASKYHLGAFFLSDGLTKDEMIYQRIIEALYPLAPNIESPFVFFKIGEPMLAGCDLMDETAVVKLARCI